MGREYDPRKEYARQDANDAQTKPSALENTVSATSAQQHIESDERHERIYLVIGLTAMACLWGGLGYGMYRAAQAHLARMTPQERGALQEKQRKPMLTPIDLYKQFIKDWEK